MSDIDAIAVVDEILALISEIEAVLRDALLDDLNKPTKAELEDAYKKARRIRLLTGEVRRHL